MTAFQVNPKTAHFALDMVEPVPMIWRSGAISKCSKAGYESSSRFTFVPDLMRLDSLLPTRSRAQSSLGKSDAPVLQDHANSVHG